MINLRQITAAVMCVVAFTVAAFDSQAWLAKRADVTVKAKSLQRAYGECLAKTNEAAENVVLPIDRHADGSIKSTVFAKKAQFFLDTNYVWAEGVTVRDTKPDKTLSTQIDAEACVVDRVARTGWIEGHARARYEKTELEGDGVYISFTNEYVSIAANAKVVTHDVKLKGHADATNVTTIAADRADYDRQQSVILLDGHVHLDNDEYKINADRAFVFLVGTNELKRIVANGSVALVNRMRSGACDRIVYDRRKNRIDMYGTSEVPAMLRDDGDRKGELEGDKISFRIDSDQVDVERPRLRLQTKKGDLKR